MSVNNNIKNNSPRTAGKRGLRRKIYRAAMVRLDYVILKNYIILYTSLLHMSRL